MPDAQYRIGDEEFLEMSAFPELIGQVLEAIEHPGVDGTAFLETGRRGPPFTVRTRVDCADLDDAVQFLQRYVLLLDEPPQSVMFGGAELDDVGVRYQVMSVRPVELRAVAGGTGGLNPPSLGWLEAEWILKPVPFET